MAETHWVPELSLVFGCGERFMLVFYSFVFMSLCCLLKLHSVCFFKILFSPCFCGLRWRLQISQPQAWECCCQFASQTISSKPFPFTVFLFFVLYCILTDHGGHILVLTAYLLSHSALVALMQELLGFT